MRDFFYFIPCMIERGGFRSERTFEIEVSDHGKLVGTANVAYLRDSNQMRLDEETPGYDERIQGFVQCRKIKNDGEQTILIEVPSADVIHVPATALTVFA